MTNGQVKERSDFIRDFKQNILFLICEQSPEVCAALVSGAFVHGLSTGHVIGRKLSVAPSGVGQQYKSICDVMAGET